MDSWPSVPTRHVGVGMTGQLCNRCDAYVRAHQSLSKVWRTMCECRKQFPVDLQERFVLYWSTSLGEQVKRQGSKTKHFRFT